MTKRFPGSLIRANPLVPTTSLASGIWTLPEVGVAEASDTWPVFQGGNRSNGSILEEARYMGGWEATDPTAGGTLTINSVALGSYDYVVKEGNQTISSFTNSDWFTTTADSVSAFVIVKGDLTVNSGQTLIPSNRKRFTVVYVTGDLVVSGGISMNSRGANAAGAATRIATGTFSSVSNPQLPAAGGAGGVARIQTGAGAQGGAVGTAGTAGGTGGGGSGWARAGTGDQAISGAGSAGTSWSGGTGGGGCNDDNGSASLAAGGGVSNGGAGGFGNNNRPDQGDLGGGGGGNPGGAAGAASSAGTAGTGGSLIIICEGELSGAGTITCNAPANNTTGGAAGGGSVTVLYGSDTSSITPTATGGTTASGGAGGAGTARKLEL